MSSNLISNHTAVLVIKHTGLPLLLSDFVKHLYMYDCKPNWTPLSLTYYVLFAEPPI